MSQTLTAEIAGRFAALALGHVTREYPNKLDHVLTGPQDVRAPRALHPIFCGSFDWHSCVHGHWLLARLYRRLPQLPEAAAIRALLDAQFTAEKVAGELHYLEQPATRGFERPYGWAWALALQAELLRHESGEGRRWASTLTPLAKEFVRRFEAYLPLATYPVRAGVHSNTAFALLLARDYAVAARNSGFAGLCADAALRWYRADRGCTGWEPSQDDFLSPALIEAALVADVMPKEDFAEWLAGFLPKAARGEPATLFTPATVSDRSDGKIAHLDGLNLSRAWCWRRIVTDLPPSDPLRVRAQAAIDAHLTSALGHVAGDYMGEHWLASFALLALDPEA
ncbi:MAG: DUF2891 domain-containing protein [Steroidobacteraceae bacterium]